MVLACLSQKCLRSTLSDHLVHGDHVWYMILIHKLRLIIAGCFASRLITVQTLFKSCEESSSTIKCDICISYTITLETGGSCVPQGSP